MLLIGSRLVGASGAADVALDNGPQLELLDGGVVRVPAVWQQSRFGGELWDSKGRKDMSTP